jgi:ribosomal protein L28
MLPLCRSAAVFGALWLALCGTTPIAGAETPKAQTATGANAAALVAEMRKSFTLNGKTIPPEIFRDFGDGDLADSGPIWITVDVAAAVGSNLYYDPISDDGQWKSQRKQRLATPTPEVTAYGFYGATANGLLVVLASYNGGGTGTFYTLHILDVAVAAGFDNDGKRYLRINLTNVRSVIMGDRWQGELKITGNAVRVITAKNGPADDAGARAPYTITAERP